MLLSTPQSVSALRDALGRLRAASEDDYEMLVAGDGELHRLITSVAGGRILRSLSSWNSTCSSHRSRRPGGGPVGR
jgi:hypothetical protein